MRATQPISKSFKKADWAYVVGRFQLPHNGHFGLIRKGLEHANRVLVVIGSHECARSALNPFTSQERMDMLRAGLSADELSRIEFTAVHDFWCNDKWVEAVHAKANEFRGPDETAVLVGHTKDHSSSYLKTLKLSLVDPGLQLNVSATSLRDIYFGLELGPQSFIVLGSQTAPAVVEYLKAFALLPVFQWITADYRATQEYRKKWTAPAYLTGDAAVVCKDQILLIQRGGNIGNGQWALPGGFMEPNESLFETATRELYEETQIAVPKGLLEIYHRGEETFSHPRRSSRGRLVTSARLFVLPFCEELPEVIPSDDAMDCRWVPLSELEEMRSQLFEDHFHIIESLVSKHHSRDFAIPD